MHDELTAVDIKKMQEELVYRRIELRPHTGAAAEADRGSQGGARLRRPEREL